MRKENQLLSRLTKIFKTDEVQAEVEQTEVQATVADEVQATVQAELEAATAEYDAVVTDLQTQLATAVASESVAQAALAELSAKYEQAISELAAIEAEKAEMIASAAAAKAAARNDKVEAAIGTEKATALLIATEGLDDAAFDAVVSALTGSVTVEAKSEMFKEVGASAEADETQIVEESSEMKLLKQKYGNKE